MTDEPLASLEPLWDDWRRALAIVAHPDDLEYNTAAAVAGWVDDGRTVTYALLTSGEAGIDTVSPAEAGRVREQEQRAAAALAGVTEVEFLGQPDGILEYGLPLRRLVAEVVRRHRPDVVITNHPRELWPGGFANQADHVATGRVVIDGVRDAGNRWIFPEQLVGGVEHWSGVREVWLTGSPDARHGVDITRTYDRGIASLLAHATYWSVLGSTPERMLDEWSRAMGARLGVERAATFEVIKVG